MSTETKQPLDIQAIRTREAAATPPPWVISTGKRGFGIGTTIFEGTEHGRVIMQSAEMGASKEQYRADCDFCANAREDIPALLQRVAELEAALRPFAEMQDDECRHLYMQEIARARHLLGTDK